MALDASKLRSGNLTQNKTLAKEEFMPVTATKRVRTSRQKRTGATSSQSNRTRQDSDILTIAEAAEYLRSSEAEVLQAIESQNLPARRLGKEWRILKSAIQRWMLTPTTREGFWETQFGAFQDDPSLDEFLEATYSRRRGVQG